MYCSFCKCVLALLYNVNPVLWAGVQRVLTCWYSMHICVYLTSLTVQTELHIFDFFSDLSNIFQGRLVGGEMLHLSDDRWHAFMYMSLHLISMCKWINTKMLERQNVYVLLPRASILCVCNIGVLHSGFQSHMGLNWHGGNYCFYNKISKPIHLRGMVSENHTVTFAT